MKKHKKNELHKVLIVYPGKNGSGGVTELYNLLDYQTEDVNYFELYGMLRDKSNILDSFFMYMRFIACVNKYDIIHLNPSLLKKSFLRDAVLTLISRLFNKKILIYWHGWSPEFENRIKINSFYSFLFKYSFIKANTSIVLGDIFVHKLRSLGFKNTIRVERNCVDIRYLMTDNCLGMDKALHTPIHLLFLSRIEKEKGIYIAIDTTKVLNEMSSQKYQLLIAGLGDELQRVKDYVYYNKITCVSFVGYVTGLKKHDLLKVSDILVFPSYCNEGLPLVILESMVYGLPVISRPVGGIPDIIINEENGILTNSKDPKIFAESVLKLSNDIKLYQKISKTNKNLIDDFSSIRFKQRLQKIYETL